MSKPHVTSVSNLPSWLTMVAKVYPPKQVALVGAGNGAGFLVQWLHNWTSDAGQGAPVVTLLEPHAPSMAQLAKRLAEIEACADWQLLPYMLAPEHGDHAYHQYTLAAENGLLPLEVLQPLWPGLKLQSQQSVATVPLTQLLPASWLLLDCLPAAQLLQGSSLPASTQVVLARVVLSDAATAGSSLASLQALLAPSGFKAVAHFAERNSVLSKALFVRDPNGLQEDIEQLAQVKEAETAAKLAEVKAKVELQSQLDQVSEALQVEKAQAKERCDELAKAKEAETAAKLAEVKAKVELQSQLDQVSKALQVEKAQAKERCDELAKAKEAETAAKLAEVKAKADLQTVKQAQEQLLKERDVLKKSKDDLDKEKQQTASKLTTQQKQITDLQNKVSQLDCENKNLNLIQQSLSTEVLKAEAQMDLIKELTRTTNAQS